MSKKKKRALVGALAVCVCCVLLLGGTYAWQDFTQHQTNRFRGTIERDVTLHDDFDGVDKDVYVENSGESDVFVRLRLDEYIQIEGVNMIGQSVYDEDAITAKTKERWFPHTFTDTPEEVSDCGQVADGIPFHSYYSWEMTGRQISYKPGTPGLVASDLDGLDEAGNPIVNPDHLKPEDPDAVQAGEQYDTKQTLPESAPIRMKEYIAYRTVLEGLDEPAEILPEIPAEGEDPYADWRETEAKLRSGCWILDADGWCYWSRTLRPGTATNLLLDRVTLKEGVQPDGDWYYGIDVKLQAVSLNDTDQWGADNANADDPDPNNGLYKTTENARKLIASWKG